MSTDWNVKCLDCDEVLYFNDANHQDEMMLALCKHAELIAAFDDVVKAAGIEVMSPWGRVDTDFFRKHLGHQLLPISEYGDLYGYCREYVKCCDCGMTCKCKLPAGHDPPCQRKP